MVAWAETDNQQGGPVGAWLGYTVMGVLVGMMMYCLVSALARHHY
jgi:amino acid permease